MDVNGIGLRTSDFAAIRDYGEPASAGGRSRRLARIISRVLAGPRGGLPGEGCRFSLSIFRGFPHQATTRKIHEMARALLLRSALLGSLILCAAGAAGAEEPSAPAAPAKPRADVQKVPTTISGTYEHGTLVSLRVGDRIAYLIKPTGEVDGERRWIWDFPFWLAINDGFGAIAHKFYVEQALAAGFHVAGVDIGSSCGSPAAADVCQEFYKLVTTEYHLHPRARLLCHSHGGLLAYGWAFRHPTCVGRIAGMCPVIDFRTYPGLASVAGIPAKNLGYGLSLDEFEKRR